MPLYEYRCQSCGKTFEVIQKFSDEVLKTHAECGGAVDRLLSAPAFHLKGTGWYATDYAKTGSSSTPAKTDEAAKTESKPDSSPAAESKPAAAAESKSPATAAKE